MEVGGGWVYRNRPGPSELSVQTSFTPSNGLNVFRFGELTFDCASRLLKRNGEEQHLSPKAQQLLAMLVVNRPRVVSREEIYDALWPATFVCETNMTSVVAELRRALGDPPRAAQYIRTVYGSGYAFTGDVETAGSEPRSAALLLCEGQRLPLYEGTSSVGRSHECDVVLTGATVSRCHALIVISGNTIILEDRGSRNGTYVDGQRITRTRVRHQAEIVFGAVPAAISRRVSSTTPVPLRIADLRRQSSDSVSTS
jgi:DNA-binding winged helix-turn-helix (wHTH) protein